MSGEDAGLTIITDKSTYNPSELVTISGSGGIPSKIVTAKILDSEGVKVSEVETRITNTGEYQVFWRIPSDFKLGEYEIVVDDGFTDSTIKISIN